VGYSICGEITKKDYVIVVIGLRRGRRQRVENVDIEKVVNV